MGLHKSTQREKIEELLKEAAERGESMSNAELVVATGFTPDCVKGVTGTLMKYERIESVVKAMGRSGARYMWVRTKPREVPRLIDVVEAPPITYGKAHPSAMPSCMESGTYDGAGLGPGHHVEPARLAFLDIPSRIGNTRYFRDGRTEAVV